MNMSFQCRDEDKAFPLQCQFLNRGYFHNTQNYPRPPL
jgi:hypothetical protein